MTARGLLCLALGTVFAAALVPSLAALDLNQLGWVVLITAMVLPACLLARAGPWQKVFFVCLLVAVLMSAAILTG